MTRLEIENKKPIIFAVLLIFLYNSVDYASEITKRA